MTAAEGDTVLTAMLLAGDRLRDFEFGGEPRAGFCLMGACQDCYVWTSDGAHLRTCTTPVTEGMRVMTAFPMPRPVVSP